MGDISRKAQKRKHKIDTSVSASPTDIDDLCSQDNSTERTVSKRSRYTFSEKQKILGKLKTEDKKSICMEYGLSDRTLRKWKKEKEEIDAVCTTGCSRHRKKSTADEDLDHALYQWFLRARAEGIPLSGPVLRTKALEIYEELGGDKQFLASDGWLTNWKRRCQIKYLSVTGEKLSADYEAAEKFKPVFRQLVDEQRLGRSQVFNFDESSITYKALPKRTLAAGDERQAPGGKAEKESYTIGACCNADGSFKLPLLVIGKYATPRPLRHGSDKLPVTYYHRKKSWMTAEFFEKWFGSVFVPQVSSFLEQQNLPQKALLLMDNFPGHKLLKIGEFECLFLPAKTTSILQPLDQGIFAAIKMKYRKRLVNSIISATRKGISMKDHLKTVNIKTMIFWADEAWREITSKTIHKCWRNLWPVETRDAETQTEMENSVILTLDQIQGRESEKQILLGMDETDDKLFEVFQSIKGFTEVTKTEICDWFKGSQDLAKPCEMFENDESRGSLPITPNFSADWSELSASESGEPGLIELQPVTQADTFDSENILSESFNVLYSS